MTNTRGPVIGDVARLAGVSVPTVSRVLNDPTQVRPERRQRVLDAIELLNYRPSAAARALASRTSRTIAIVAGNTSQYGYASTIEGIEENARAHGFAVTITVIESADPAHVERAVSQVLTQGPAGVLVLKFDPQGVAVLEALPKTIPIVAISGVKTRDVSQALIDELQAAQALTDHLLELGHATVHHVRVPPSRREDGRTTGWRKALTKAGASIPPLFDATWEPESGRLAGNLIADDPSVTAVFCGNDEIAMGVIRGLTERGLNVPADVSVVGFDDHPLAALWSPALTTVHQDFGGLGKRAFELLLESMAGVTVAKHSTVKPHVVVRESSAAPPARRRATAQ